MKIDNPAESSFLTSIYTKLGLGLLNTNILYTKEEVIVYKCSHIAKMKQFVIFVQFVVQVCTVYI